MDEQKYYKLFQWKWEGGVRVDNDVKAFMEKKKRKKKQINQEYICQFQPIRGSKEV